MRKTKNPSSDIEEAYSSPIFVIEANDADDSLAELLDLSGKHFAIFSKSLDIAYEGVRLDELEKAMLLDGLRFENGRPVSEADRVAFDLLAHDRAVVQLDGDATYYHEQLVLNKLAHNESLDALKEEHAGQVFKLEEDIDRLADKNARQERYLVVGGGLGAAAAMAGVVAYMRQKKTHDAVMQVLMDTLRLLHTERANPTHVNFTELAVEVFDKVGAIETRSLRRPFAIKLSELDRTLKLLVELLQVAETLVRHYAGQTPAPEGGRP